MQENVHVPVLLEEVISFLQLQSEDSVIDCTLGGGGHAMRILEATAPHGQLLGLDWDEAAIETARTALGGRKELEDRVTLVHASYTRISKVAADHGFQQVAAILCDLGYSSNQIEDTNRGFSFQEQGELDMRYDHTISKTAHSIVHSYSEDELMRIFTAYGEEPQAKNIVRAIVDRRKTQDITGDVLRELVEDIYKKVYKKPSHTHPATRVWQALRIEVNDEFENIKELLPQAIALLRPGGRLAVITFHSLEDRIVKQYFKQESKDCLCPPESPVCICDHTAQIKLITKKPVVPSEKEQQHNPRARSAKLRVVEKQ